MVLDDETSAAHELYMNHVMRCTKCHPPTNRYCSDGEALSNRYISTYLMTQDIYERRVFLAKLETLNPARCEAIKAQLIDLHGRAKQEAA